MKAVILAGGLGTRLSEETDIKPKPMVEIGGMPILWHIMKIYASHGVTDFIICLGYKGYVVKEYFSNYFLHRSDVTFDLKNNSMEVHQNLSESWRVTLVDTGPETMTGGRLLRVKDHLDDAPFCFTYGDGVGDVDITSLIKFHNAHGKLATLTATRKPGRYGALVITGDQTVNSFQEKPELESGWINGGFFVLHPKSLDYIDDDATSWELDPLTRLSSDGELKAFKHSGFWQPMDTLKEKNDLNKLWLSGDAPWKCWS